MRSPLQTILLAVVAPSLGAAGPLASSGSEPEAIRLLVRGDDMGFSHASNLAHIRCYREGVMRTVEVLAAGPWLFVDHPALDTPETRAIHHVRYEDVAIDRQGVTDAWTSRAVKAVVERRGIQLISYRDLGADSGAAGAGRARQEAAERSASFGLGN